MMFELGTIISNRYEIVDVLGKGGMAIVYKARDAYLDRFVTFKVLREEFANDSDFVNRFTTEAQAIARLNHPNIVGIHDVGSDVEYETITKYLVIEYIDAVTLKELIVTRAPFSDDIVLGVSHQIAEALRHAHSNDIVHRDIKPQNVLVAKGGTVKVTDFGIAKTLTVSQQTMKNTTLGSVHYSSPEQTKGEYVDSRSDIYSLGVVMYEMATGVLPFDGDNVTSIAMMHLNDELPPIREHNPDISNELEAIIVQAVEKNAEDRFESIEAMIYAIKNAQSLFDDSLNRYDGETGRIQLSSEEIEALNDTNRKKIFDPLYDDYDDEFDKEFGEDDNGNKVVIITAILTSIILMSIIAFFGYFVLGIGRNTTPQVVQEQNGNGENGYENNDNGLIINGDDIENENGDNGEAEIDVQMVIMPNFVGMSTDDVDAFIRSNGLHFEYTTMFEYSDTIPLNRVARQSTEAGTSVPSDSSILLHISRGAEVVMTTVPNVVGMTRDAAIRAIENAGLRVNSPNLVYSDTVAVGIVISQTEASGSSVAANSHVGITVSLGVEPPPAVPDVPDVPDTTDTPDDVSAPDDTTEPDNTTTPNDNGDNGDNNGDDLIEIEREVVVLTVDFPIPDNINFVDIKIFLRRNTDISQVLEDVVMASAFPLSYNARGNGHANLIIHLRDYENTDNLFAVLTPDIDFGLDDGEGLEAGQVWIFLE
jgi:serine/threonine-protein kinase